MIKDQFGTKEWAESNFNFCRGCQHDCLYCYAKSMAIRFGRATNNTWRYEKPLPANLTKVHRKRHGRIMLPSTHDITPNTVDLACEVISSSLSVGNKLLIVSKPHLSCIKQLIPVVIPYADQVMFRFTIGSCDNNILKYWEPGAPSFEERLDCLKTCHAEGFNTSVSAEPMLDTKTATLIESLRPYVTDAIWVGKPNMLLERICMNGGTTAQVEAGVQLLRDLSNDYVMGLYNTYKADPLVKWKESVKKIVGIDLVQVAGADI